MRDQTASLLIGTLADQALADARTGESTQQGRAAAERLRRLLAVVIAFRTGELSSTPADPEISASAAYSLLATAALRLGVLREGLAGLERYATLLNALRDGALEPAGRERLEPFLELLGNWSAEVADNRVTAFLPDRADGRRRSWTRRP
jgi:hypothetical protein